jgi:hypothetical protein
MMVWYWVLKCVWLVHACIFTGCYYFLAMESSEECTEEGEVYEYQEEEDQGQANQGKPSNLFHIWILFTCFAGCIKVFEIACFYIAIALVAIILLAQAPRAYCYHPLRWPPRTPTLHPCRWDLLISSKASGNPLVEPKTLGWEHSKSFLENVFETLGVASTPLKCFTIGFEQWWCSWRIMELVVFKWHWWSLGIHRNNLPVQPHYPGMGRGLIRSLFALVQEASHYIRVCRTLESRLPQEYGQ